MQSLTAYTCIHLIEETLSGKKYTTEWFSGERKNLLWFSDTDAHHNGAEKIKLIDILQNLSTN